MRVGRPVASSATISKRPRMASARWPLSRVSATTSTTTLIELSPTRDLGGKFDHLADGHWRMELDIVRAGHHYGAPRMPARGNEGRLAHQAECRAAEQGAVMVRLFGEDHFKEARRRSARDGARTGQFSHGRFSWFKRRGIRNICRSKVRGNC